MDKWIIMTAVLRIEPTKIIGKYRLFITPECSDKNTEEVEIVINEHDKEKIESLDWNKE